MTSATQGRLAAPADRRWLVLIVVAVAQLMVVLDSTVVNIALPSAQRSLGFPNDDRQWVVTAYALAFGSLLLVGGRPATCTAASGSSSRAWPGSPSPRPSGRGRFVRDAGGGPDAAGRVRRHPRTVRPRHAGQHLPGPARAGRAFGVFGSVAAGGGGVGLILGGVLTEYLSWRWTLYVNLVFAAIAIAGALAYMRSSLPVPRPRMDWPGAVLACAGLFLIVFGFSHAEIAGWTAEADRQFPGARRVPPCRVCHRRAPVLAPAAAVARDPRPHPRRLLCRGRPLGNRDLRRLPVPHLLPAGGQGVQPGDQRAGFPADDRLHPAQLQCLQHRDLAPVRAARPDRHRHAARRRRR